MSIGIGPFSRGFMPQIMQSESSSSISISKGQGARGKGEGQQALDLLDMMDALNSDWNGHPRPCLVTPNLV